MTWIVPPQDRFQTPHITRGVRPIEIVVYHNTVTGPGRGPQGSDRPRMERWLSGRGARSSTHFVITRSGDVLQGAGLDQRTWHAGKSEWRGKKNLSMSSIGIDFENTGRGEPFTPQQYASVERLIRQLAQHFPQLRDRSRHVGHSDIAPGRKIDPGPLFNWGVVDRALRPAGGFGGGGSGGGYGIWIVAALAAGGLAWWATAPARRRKVRPRRVVVRRPAPTLARRVA